MSTATKQAIPFILAGLLFSIFAGSQVREAEREQTERAAYHCALATVADFDGPEAGTDAALADCYTSRGLAVPSDI